jgi:serine/threonine protein kinase/tetratricopeptide (TPR) repeat protein
MADLSGRLKAALSDRYTIERELGSGGMATVYLAEDLKHHRKVAVKVLLPELAAALGSERFLREIEVTAGLTHPHILPLFDSGEADGFLYYVMPYIAGESLRQRLNRETQLPVDDALGIARQVAAALDFAHRHDVVHRDVKPENILLHEGEALVADFGIALAVTAAGGERLTETGLSIGTPAYMSPEQVTGDRAIDGRSDIYSLACVLYEMLAGEPPYTGPTAQAILARKLSEAVPRLSLVRERVPGDVEAAIGRALATTPADRFPTAAELAAALAGASRPIASPSAVAPPDQPPSIAVLPLANLSADPEQEYFCDGIAEEIINALAQVEGLRVVARSSSFAFKGRSVDVREVGRSLDVDAVLEGSVRKAENRLRITAQLIDVANGYHLWSQRFDRQLEDVFAIQDEISLAVVDSLKVKLLTGERASIVRRHTYSLEAYDAYLKGLFEWNTMTPTGLVRCQELFREAIGLDPEFAPAYAQLADSFTSVTWWADQPPGTAMAQALPLAEQALTLDPYLAHAHSVMGHVRAFMERDRTAGERSLRRAVELAPSGALAQTYLALFLDLMEGSAQEAVARARLALRLDPLSPAMHAWAGAILHFSGEPEEGLHALEEQVTATPQLWMPHYFLSLALAASGRLEEARAAAEQAVQLSAHNSVTLSHLVCLCTLTGDRERSDELFQRLQQRAGAVYVPPMLLAWAHTTRGETDAALRCVEEALAAKDPWISAHRLNRRAVVPAEPRVDAVIAGSCA